MHTMLLFLRLASSNLQGMICRHCSQGLRATERHCSASHLQQQTQARSSSIVLHSTAQSDGRLKGREKAQLQAARPLLPEA